MKASESSPHTSPHNCDIQATTSSTQRPARKKKNKSWRLPLLSMFTSGPVWALITATIQQRWSENVFIREIIGMMGELNCHQLWDNFSTVMLVLIPFILNWFISLSSGLISDVLVNRKILNATACRRIVTFIGIFM